MAMRARVIDLPAAAAPKKARHGARCDVVGILSASSLIQGQIEKAMTEPLPALLHTESCLRYWTAFVQLKHPAATLDVWLPLCEAMNIAMLLCEEDIGAQYLDLFIAAQEAIFRAWMRGERTGSYRLDGPGIAVITEALEVHDAQLDVSLRGDLAKAERTMLERMAEGNHYKAEPVAA
ncbi:hypothetical protein [Massilia sp. TSP1-1-2]|uniref:hypothetical protein n=1 Tax=Massilia sp. TSP1-1-2 TaxID=2804649 RepID=UPI003CF9218F